MGMFDYVSFEMDCPKCGSRVGGWQSKDGPCVMDTISPEEVADFYSSCDKCKTWIEFARVTERKEPPPVMTRAEVEALGFSLFINHRAA